MASYIFKVKRINDTQAEILSEPLNCASDPQLADPSGDNFATYYSNVNYVVRLKTMDGNDEPWKQQVDMDASGSGSTSSVDNACEGGASSSHYTQYTGVLNRSGSGVNPTITISSGVLFPSTDIKVAYLKERSGLVGNFITADFKALSMLQVQTTAVIRAGHFIENMDNSAAEQKKKILLVEKTAFAGASDKYTYRLYFNNVDDLDGEKIDLTGGDNIKLTGSTGVIGGANNLAPQATQLGPYTSGLDFRAAHIFTNSQLAGVGIDTSNDAGKANYVGIKPDAGFAPGSNNEFGEYAKVETAIVRSEWIDDASVGSPNTWSTNNTKQISVIGNGVHDNDCAVIVNGQAGVGLGDSGTANIDYDGNGFQSALPDYYLGQKQDWGWMYSTSAPPSCTPSIGTSVTQSAVNSTSTTTPGAKIEGKVTSIGCLPDMASSDSGNYEIKADFVKGGAVISSAIVKDTHGNWAEAIGGSGKTGFDKTNLDADDGSDTSKGGTAVTWTINWYANSGTSASPTWGSAIHTENVTVNTGPAFNANIVKGTGGQACGINITLNAASASLGTALRAIVFVDSDGDYVLDGGEPVVAGAKVSGSVIDFSSTGIDFTISSLPTTVYLDLDEATNIAGKEKYIIEWQFLNQTEDPDAWEPLNQIGFTLNGGGSASSYPSSLTHQNMVVPASECAACASTEHFIEITSAAGDWNGKIYNCAGSVTSTVATPAKWYDESPWAGFTGSAVGTGWTGGTPNAASACNLGAGSFTNVNTGSNIIYVSGTTTNYRQDSDRLRIYRGADKTLPLAAGWYRFCGTVPALVANGVPEVREPFNCYGNPFIWYSAKPRSAFVLDSNDYLTHGSPTWHYDAAMKDLTTTGCDLGVKDLGSRMLINTSKSTMERTTVSRNCISGHQNGGGSPQNKDIVKFDNTKKKTLSRSPYDYHPSPATGQVIISSPSTTATEITAALSVDCSSAGEIFKLTDIVDSTGRQLGTWNEIEAYAAKGNTIVESWLSLSYNGSNAMTLQTGKRTLSWDSSTSTASWGSPTTVSLVSGTVSGWAIVSLTATSSGHSIKINGSAAVSNTSASLFCNGSVGISNLNTRLGGDDQTGTFTTMDFAELIVYNEELNSSEIEEVEGYLADKWCKQLASDSHPYYSNGPNCEGCPSECCEEEVTISSSTSSNVIVTANYKCSTDRGVFGYQFKLSGLAGLNMTAGRYKAGDTIPTSVSGKTFGVAFTDPLAKAFTNYLVVDNSSDVWIVGHFYDGGTGSFGKVLPPTGVSTEFLKVTITETSSSAVQNWSGIAATLVTSNSGINTPSTPHPVLAVYTPDYPYRQIHGNLMTIGPSGYLSPVKTFNGDSTGDGTVTLADAEEIVKRIPLSHAAGLFDLSGDTWLETLDASNKGWLDVTDVVSTLLFLQRNGTGGGSGTPISNSATVASSASTKSVLSTIACTNKLVPTECDPCPCPELREPEDCVSKVWIDNIEPIKSVAAHSTNFAIVTVRYQSSCCINGYKITLGGQDPLKVGQTSWNDGAVFIPSYGNAIGQLPESESHMAKFLHGTTLDPSYSGDIGLQNAAYTLLWQITQIAGVPPWQNPAVSSADLKNKLNFPVVWGMDIDPELENCIPPTCPGESKVLTKFVVNMASFSSRPFIEDFRLVTNETKVTPISFDAGSGITWTGDGVQPHVIPGLGDADTTVDQDDWNELLLYLWYGWGRASNFSDSTIQTILRNNLKQFDAENDNAYLDIVDALTVQNHKREFGYVNGNTSAEVVPQDCCPCPVPGDFTVTLKRNPCFCWEQDYVKGGEGLVTLTWTPSSNATGYLVYRYEQASTGHQNSRTGSNESAKTDRYGSTIATGSNGEVFYNKQFSDNYRNYQDTKIDSQWQLLTKIPSDITTWVDKTPPRYEDCCPDDVLPTVIYVVVAVNDCGEKSRIVKHTPECCAHEPIARDVDLGERVVNTPVTFMADAYHPYAMNPWGGVGAAATAEVKFVGVPTDGSYIILTDFKNKTHRFIFNAGGGSSTSTVTYINTSSANTVTLVGDAFVTAVEAALDIDGTNSSGTVALVQKDSDNSTNCEYTDCGNTKVIVKESTVGNIKSTDFTGGIEQCLEFDCNGVAVPGWPTVCEPLTFDIVAVTFTHPATGTGAFVGPYSSGGALPGSNPHGKWQWVPPMGYIGDVYYKYVVTNKNGCFDTGQIKVRYKPVKTKLNCETYPCHHPDYGKVKLWFDLPAGVVGEARILRQSASTYTGPSSWNTGTGSPQILNDANGDPVVVNLEGWPDTVPWRYMDLTANTPGECCTEPITYVYAVVICIENGHVTSGTTSAGSVSGGNLFCEVSSICRVVIPCCPAPHNPIPDICNSDCDGTAARATIVIEDSGGIQQSDTFTLVDSAGKSTVYTINGGVLPGNGGGSSGAATVGFQGVGGGTAGKVAAAAAMVSAINATTDANYTAVSNGVDTVTITQGTVGSVGNKTNADSIGHTTVSNFACGFDAADHPSVRISWSPITPSDNAIGYNIYRKPTGATVFAFIGTVYDQQVNTNPNWDASSKKFFYLDKDIIITNNCEPGVSFEYAVTAFNAYAQSGDPNDTQSPGWGYWAADPGDSVNQGDPCSPGGTTLRVAMENCPPTPCLDDVSVNICLDDTHEIDLSALTGCLPVKSDGTVVSGTWSIVSTGYGWVSYSFSSPIVTIDTHGIDWEAVGAGPHNAAIVWKFKITDSDCPSEVTANINITLEDCGCPCPDDEKDYTICDVNYDTAEYVADSKLSTIEQLPFSFGREGGQALRKGQAYAVSRGKIDYD